MSDEILQEIMLDSLTPKKISKKRLRVDKKAIILAVPDTNIKFHNVVYNSGLLLNNCESIVGQNKIVKLGTKTYNGKSHYLDLKKELQAKKDVGRKLRVASTLNSLAKLDREAQRYSFLDMSLQTKAFRYYAEKSNLKRAGYFLFTQIEKKFKELKKKYPTVTCELMFFVNSQDGHLMDVFNNVRTIIPSQKLEELTLFDNFGLVSNCDNTIIPLFHKEKMKTKFIFNNLLKLHSHLKKKEIVEKAKDEKTINTSVDEPKDGIGDVKNSVTDKLVRELATSKLKASQSDFDEIEIEIDTKQLTKILKKYEITDPDIIANVKTALDTYIKQMDSTPTHEDAEKIVLKAINFSIHGTTVLPDEYKIKPELLFEKLQNQQTHKTPLLMNTFDSHLIQGEDVVDIDYTTGSWRQKYEFEEVIHSNIKKLFESIEDKSTRPVKVKKIKHEIEDDNSNRMIKYTITLENINGGTSKPYDVELYVPAIVNDRYFRLKGNDYIITNQQFMKPVTKKDVNDVRVLSNYAIVRLTLENIKFGPNQIDEIVNYIQVRYAGVIKENNNDSIVFDDGSIAYKNGTTLYEDKETDEVVRQDEDDGHIKNQDDEIICSGKFEFLYDLLIDKIQDVNPDDELGKSTHSIPYICVYLGGNKLPFLFYLWQLKGLYTTLHDLDIEYEIRESPKDAKYIIALASGKYVCLLPESRRNKYICNGLLYSKIRDKFENPDDPKSIENYITNHYGQKAITNINLLNQWMIDPVTRELLEFENLPTQLHTLLSTHCVDKLMNDKPDKLSDLSTYRSRLSEMMLNFMYKQIAMAHNEYNHKVENGIEDAKVNIQPDKIINDLLGGSGVLDYATPINPIDEIFSASKTIKTGPGGVPGARSLTIQHRNLDETHIGNMSATATPESGNVGALVSHTLTPMIVNEYGSYGRKNPDNMSGWQALAINEALVPFQNQMESDRLMLASAHTKQVTPTNGNEPPLIGTGAEYMVPQLSSSRFVQRAKKDGKVVHVNNSKTVTVQYKDGSEEVFDISPRLSASKMNQQIILSMKHLKEGDTFKKNQPVAFTKNFSEDGIYASGKNVFMAMMNYNGLSHEDAYVISEKLAGTMSRELIRECQIVIYPNTKVLHLEKEIGKKVTHNDVLVEFSTDQDLSEYLEQTKLDQLDFEDGDETDNLLDHFSEGDNTIKLSADDGEIIDIKVFINNKNSIDKQLVQFYNEIKKDVQDNIKELSKGKTSQEELLKVTDNMQLNHLKTGGHKLKGGVEFEGARVVYKIKKTQNLAIGDKMATRYGAKGVISEVIMEHETPFSENKHEIECFISPYGVIGRKNQAMVKELYLGKVIYYLNQKVQKMAKDTRTNTDTIIKLIMDVYGLLADEELLDKIKKRLDKYTPNKLREALKSGKLKLHFTVAPFKTISFESIQTAAKHLDIELDEKVYLPKFESWSKQKVPVGLTYIQALEQTSQIYENSRSTGKYNRLTGQSTKGASKQGGQTIGQLDINALLSYDAPNIVNELTGLASDDHKTKKQVINDIIENGHSDKDTSKKVSDSLNLAKIYLRSLGLTGF